MMITIGQKQRSCYVKACVHACTPSQTQLTKIFTGA